MFRNETKNLGILMCKAQLKPGILAIRTKKEASNCAELMVHSVDSDFTLDFSSVDVGCVSEREIAIETWVSAPVASRRARDRGDVDDGGVG